MQEKSSLAVYLSPQELSCLLPDWGSTYSESQTVLQIRSNGVLLSKVTIQPVIITFKPFWIALSVTSGDAGGGDVLSIQASALITDSDSAPYKCVFTSGSLEMESELTSALSPSHIACKTPTWGQFYSAQTTKVSLKNVFSNALVQFKGSPRGDSFEFLASWVKAQEATIASSGDTLNMIGAGFDTTKSYRCSLSKGTNSITSFPANPLSPTTFACASPSWGSFYEATTAVMEMLSEDGALLQFSGEPGYKNVVVLETWDYVNITTTSASGSTSLALTGYGFDSGSTYTCKLQTISTADHWQGAYLPPAWAASARRRVQTVASGHVHRSSLGALACTVPEWGGLYAAAAVSVVLTRFTSERVQYVGPDPPHPPCPVAASLLHLFYSP